MVSLCIIAAILPFIVLLDAWAVGWSARAAGSPSGRFGVGLRVVLLIFALNIVLAVIGGLLPAMATVPTLIAAFALLAIQPCASFFMLRDAFSLTAKRTFAPLGAYWAVALVVLGLTQSIVKPFLIEAFVITSESMAPTLELGDRFVVNKIIRPQRWDLVAYWNEFGGHSEIYCKRLIGLPGERLRFDEGKLFVNDQPVAMPPILEGRLHAAPAGAPQTIWQYTDGQTIVLTDAEFFVIGDDVDRSADSRMYGPTRGSALVGVVDLIYWPLMKACVVR